MDTAVETKNNDSLGEMLNIRKYSSVKVKYAFQAI